MIIGVDGRKGRAKAMNTNKLQSFAAEARTSLMKAVRARIDAALEPNSLA